MIARQRIHDFVDRVVERFQPTRVILFRSYAYGRPNEDADVDLMVVMPRRGPSPKASAGIQLECAHDFPDGLDGPAILAAA